MTMDTVSCVEAETELLLGGDWTSDSGTIFIMNPRTYEKLSGREIPDVCEPVVLVGDQVMLLSEYRGPL